jgi:hypothetical protein
VNRRLLYLGIVPLLIVLLIASLAGTQASLRNGSVISPVDIEQLMQAQVDIGPRHPGSQGSLDFRDWLLEIVPSGWNVEIQEYTVLGIEARNYLITHDTSESWSQILIGAHYDSRRVADQDGDNPDLPVPGANDGASGVAGILEMMDHMGPLTPVTGFVLFDAEDQGRGGIDGWNYIMGSEYFVSQMSDSEINATKIFILYDMIANDQLKLKYEGNSDSFYRESIWDKGIALGYGDIFDKRVGPYLIDDHRPFLNVGIPAVDIIDFTYPEWHTTEDNMENVSAESAAIVVDTVLEWLLNDFDDVLVPPYTPTTQTPAVSSTITESSFVSTLVLPSLLVQIIRRRISNFEA